jgi:hypothetical protein
MARIRMPIMFAEKSHIYKSGIVLRHEDTGETVATPKDFATAKTYCRQRGFDMRKTWRGK